MGTMLMAVEFLDARAPTVTGFRAPKRVALTDRRRGMTPAQAAKARYRNAHPDRTRESHELWYAANRDKAIERAVKWNREHIEVKRTRDRLRMREKRRLAKLGGPK